ncbi:MAG: NOG1 family protein [Methanobacteriota archaeon]
MFDLPSVLRAQEVLDKAFARASRATAKGTDRAARTRNLAVARVRIAGDTIASTLSRTVRGFPSVDRLPPFYAELVDVLADRDALKHHLGAVDWAAKRAAEIAREYRRRAGSAPARDLSRLRAEAFGRLASIVKQVADDLDALVAAKIALRRLPSIDPDLPTIVVAGYPNVGKSAFVRAVSTGKPKVAEYPFTTKGVSVGHLDVGHRRFQVLDTPGLLDRPMEKRNRIERQAIAALAHVADVVVFLLDPTETCGYPLEAQTRLLDEVRRIFPGVPIVAADNKSDLPGPMARHKRMSALTGQGVQEVLDAALASLTSRGPGGAPRRAEP